MFLLALVRVANAWSCVHVSIPGLLTQRQDPSETTPAPGRERS